eukprot:IDg11752t1
MSTVGKSRISSSKCFLLDAGVWMPLVIEPGSLLPENLRMVTAKIFEHNSGNDFLDSVIECV